MGFVSASVTASPTVGAIAGLDWIKDGQVVNFQRSLACDKSVYLNTGLYVSQSAGVANNPAVTINSGINNALVVSGSTIISGSTVVTGSITIQSGSGDLYVYGHKQFNVGAFQSNTTQSGSSGVSQSMQFETTDISQGVSMVSGSRITITNAGTYNIQFSAQIDRVAGSGTDTAYIWLKKNGSNVSTSAGAVTVSGAAAAAKTIASWNYVVNAATNDYYELAWQTTDTNIQLINANASGNVPGIPSIILTVTQVR
jgi:hypothetical protein